MKGKEAELATEETEGKVAALQLQRTAEQHQGLKEERGQLLREWEQTLRQIRQRSVLVLRGPRGRACAHDVGASAGGRLHSQRLSQCVAGHQRCGRVLAYDVLVCAPCHQHVPLSAGRLGPAGE